MPAPTQGPRRTIDTTSPFALFDVWQVSTYPDRRGKWPHGYAPTHRAAQEWVKARTTEHAHDLEFMGAYFEFNADAIERGNGGVN